MCRIEFDIDSAGIADEGCDTHELWIENPRYIEDLEILESDIDDCDIEGPMTQRISWLPTMTSLRPPIERFSHSMTIPSIVSLTSITSIQHTRTHTHGYVEPTIRVCTLLVRIVPKFSVPRASKKFN